MITGIFGSPGSGKSLYALFLMQQAANAGRPIYTNIELTPACPYYHRAIRIDSKDWPVTRGTPTKKEGNKWVPNPDYLCYWHYIKPGSVVVIDEANIYFDCNDHGEFGTDARQFHQQHRKFGLDIVYLCQNLPNMWVRIRRLIARFIICEWNYRTHPMWKHLPIGWSRFLRSEYGDENFRDHRGDGYFTYGEARRMFSWYKTEQILGETSFYRSLYNDPARLKGDEDDQPGSVCGTDGPSAGDGDRGSAAGTPTPPVG